MIASGSFEKTMRGARVETRAASFTSNEVEEAEAKLSLLLVGNFLSGSRGSRGVCEDLAERLSQDGQTVHTTSGRDARLPRLFDMLKTIWTKRHSYSIAHVDVYSGPAFVWAEAVCWMLHRAGKPYLLTLHGGGLPAFAGRWPTRMIRLLKSAERVTTPSRYLQERMVRYRADLLLLPNPLSIERYPFRERSAPLPRLTWLRAFHKIYNPALAPRVLDLLASDFRDARLEMIGPDKADGSLEQTREETRRLGLAPRVSFSGRVPKTEVGERLNAGDIFLNTTSVDNAPVSVLEALACGLCVVSTNVCGIPYLLEHERDALLVPPDDAQAMAAAVRRILTEPRLAARLSVNGRRKAERLDWSVILPLWKRLFAEALAKSEASAES